LHSMHIQRLCLQRGGRLAHGFVRRSMATDSARPRKRRKESTAAAEGWQPEVQWGDSFSLPGLAVQNLSMRVPLVHEQPDGERITVFARMVSQPGRTTKPLLLFLQGPSPPTRTPPANVPSIKADLTDVDESSKLTGTAFCLAMQLIVCLTAARRTGHRVPSPTGRRRMDQKGDGGLQVDSMRLASVPERMTSFHTRFAPVHAPQPGLWTRPGGAHHGVHHASPLLRLPRCRVVLLDQRGTGLSAGISAKSLLRRGSPAQQAEYLTNFR